MTIFLFQNASQLSSLCLLEMAIREGFVIWSPGKCLCQAYLEELVRGLLDKQSLTKKGGIKHIGKADKLHRERGPNWENANYNFQLYVNLRFFTFLYLFVILLNIFAVN